MKIVIPGGSGQVGTLLARSLTADGHDVVVLSRRPDSTHPWNVVVWDGVAVGDGPLESEIRKLVADLNLTGVNFTGIASRQEIGKYYDQADIFLNASWLDNMPLSIIEAFAAGTPVVTTSPECMPYLVEHERTGLLSPVGDYKMLAANVIRLLRDPVLAGDLARNAHGESQKYTWQNVRDQWIKSYLALV